MVEFTSGFQGALRRLLYVVWFTTVSPALVLAAGPGEVHSRVLNSLKFADEILGRRVVIVTELKRYEGRDSYAARAETTSPPFRQGASQDAATLRRDPDVLALELLEPYPVDDRSFLIKVLQTRDRNCNINYRGTDTRSEIHGISEGPNRVAWGDDVSYIGSGVWYGYLLGSELPEFSTLVSEVDWESRDGGLFAIGTYSPRQIEIEFQDNKSSRPRRITVVPSVPGTLDDAARQATTIEFVDWDMFAGIECPKTVVKWELGCYTRGKLETRASFMTLQSVGPIVELTERYGDFFTDVPEGHRVQVNDHMAIDFVWQNGEIVRKVDKVKLGSLIGQSFFGSPVRRLVMMGIGLVVLAVITSIVWRRSKESSVPTAPRR